MAFRRALLDVSLCQRGMRNIFFQQRARGGEREPQERDARRNFTLGWLIQFQIRALSAVVIAI
jgi:hypothetical protein